MKLFEMIGTTASTSDVASMKKELVTLKSRLDKVEKSALLLGGKKRTGVSDFVESLQANTMAMNAKTVEICAVVTFFTIGTVVGASLLDRLWYAQMHWQIAFFLIFLMLLSNCSLIIFFICSYYSIFLTFNDHTSLLSTHIPLIVFIPLLVSYSFLLTTFFFRNST
jgi:hypothetical protein